MFISTRKVEYDGRQEYLYDVIVKDPSWVYEKMYNSLTPIEKIFYDAITSRRPSSDTDDNLFDDIEQTNDVVPF